ncbi:DUF4396 domain-containing protein [Burkholderia sp. M6-3]
MRLKPVYEGITKVASPEFWFAMHLAMLAGSKTSDPVNWWLIRIGEGKNVAVVDPTVQRMHRSFRDTAGLVGMWYPACGLRKATAC